MGIGVAYLLQNRPIAAPAPVGIVTSQPPITVIPPAAPTVAPSPTKEPPGLLMQAPALPTEAAPTIVKVPAFNPKPAPDAPAGIAAPLFAPTYDPNDGKPVFICGVDAFASYLTLLQMQVSGKDVAHGFHLGIIPFELNEQYQLSEQDSSELLTSGKADCQLDTVDTVASASQGVITAIVDESAGGDGMWARGLGSMYDLRGKRIAYIKDSSSEFFMRYVLGVAQIPASEVTLVPAESIDEVMQLFNEGKADAVSAWEPQLSAAQESGGASFLTTEQLRVIVDTIMVSHKSIEERPDVVQAFHDAWFDTMKAQTEDFALASAQIAAWGGNDWSAISVENAANDFRDQLKLIAQADLADNLAVMSNLAPVINQLNVSRKVWSEVTEVPTDSVETLVDPQFVLRTAAKLDALKLKTDSQPINDSFSLAAAATPAAQTQPMSEVIATPPTPSPQTAPTIATDDAATLAVLPCRKFTFLPDSAELTPESRKVLDLCVVPTLQQRAGLSLLVKGSAAWPGPKGTYTAQQVKEVATARARAIANYLILQKIDPKRLVVEGVLPPQENWETTDSIRQAEDRFVQMTLISGGR
jgi:ABC-type nitrate/sulfonate/bicarbonate transport system substrate-binding protein/outer membrane protein OmpA-like peptidoglycan-associated protein